MQHRHENTSFRHKDSFFPQYNVNCQNKQSCLRIHVRSCLTLGVDIRINKASLKITMISALAKEVKTLLQFMFNFSNKSQSKSQTQYNRPFVYITFTLGQNKLLQFLCPFYFLNKQLVAIMSEEIIMPLIPRQNFLFRTSACLHNKDCILFVT